MKSNALRKILCALVVGSALSMPAIAQNQILLTQNAQSPILLTQNEEGCRPCARKSTYQACERCSMNSGNTQDVAARFCRIWQQKCSAK
jgi:hypothetical protein